MAPRSTTSVTGHDKLLASVAAARQAVIYLNLLERIEASEHPYHRHAVLERLRRTFTILRRPPDADLDQPTMEHAR